MLKKTTKKRRPQAKRKVRTELPPGINLLRTLEGHQDAVMSLAFNRQGDILASGGYKGTIKLWDTHSGVGHLENYGYVKRLRTSKGEVRILLEPERLNNLASSFVLEARRNPKGLGALEEKRLLAGGYEFPELRDLDHAECDVLLDSAALLFLRRRRGARPRNPPTNVSLRFPFHRCVYWRARDGPHSLLPLAMRNIQRFELFARIS